MEIRELITFISLSKTLNYQKSASELQYAPSTLKKHISNLETELRVPLFEKAGRGIQITPEGSRFIEYAQNLVSGYNQAVENLAGKRYEEKPLTVAGCEANLLCEMDEAVRTYTSQHADSPFLKSICSNSAVQELVKCGFADIGFCYTLDAQPIEGVESVMLYRERLRWMAAHDHPLSKKEKVRYDDFAGQSIVTRHLDCCFINDGLRRIRQKGVDSVDLLSIFLCEAQKVEPGMLTTKCIYLRPDAVIASSVPDDCEYLDMDEEPCWVWNRIVIRPEVMQDERVKALLKICRKAAEQRVDDDGLSYMPYA